MVTPLDSKNINQILPFGLQSSVLDLVGNTPLMEISHLPLFEEFENIKVFAKLEFFNYTNSVKARPVLWMIREAERRGILDKSKILLEPTSGNTGIAMAGIAQLKGHRVTLVMPESMSKERRDIMQSYEAQLVLTPADEGMDGAIHKAREMVRNEPKYVMLDQFSNQANVQSHFETTGPEIWVQSRSQVDWFVAGMGTGGTLMGVGSFLRLQNSQVQIVGVEPHANTPIPGLKNMTTSEVPAIFNANRLDAKIIVSMSEAIATVRQFAKEAAMLIGPSSGAALTGLLKLLRVQKASMKGNIVVLFPDDGLKYLSQEIFLKRRS
ncbi:MAG: PLP-dependent cysteine synthase family protein [Candidatus Hodarchaeota archaeon]